MPQNSERLFTSCGLVIYKSRIPLLWKQEDVHEPLAFQEFQSEKYRLNKTGRDKKRTRFVIRLVVKLPQGGDGPVVTQQPFGRRDDEGLPELAVDLAAQQVEVVGRRCAICDLC